LNAADSDFLFFINATFNFTHDTHESVSIQPNHFIDEEPPSSNFSIRNYEQKNVIDDNATYTLPLIYGAVFEVGILS